RESRIYSSGNLLFGGTMHLTRRDQRDFEDMLERTPQTEKELSAADLAYGGIIDLVLNSELRPGERTSVNLLAARLDLGRTPVKEAITRLQTEGLLSVAGRSGTMVNRIDHTQTEHLFALRNVLEDFAADGAVKNITAEQLGRLRELLRDLREHPVGQ